MKSKTFAKPLSAIDARFEAQKIAFGPVVFQCVRIARKWGLLESIDRSPNGSSVEELAADHRRSDYAVSVLLESCLSAGIVGIKEDRYYLEKIGDLVELAWRKGAKLDDYRDNFSIWEEAMVELGIDSKKYIGERKVHCYQRKDL